jgi:hypothetical protein
MFGIAPEYMLVQRDYDSVAMSDTSARIGVQYEGPLFSIVVLLLEPPVA